MNRIWPALLVGLAFAACNGDEPEDDEEESEGEEEEERTEYARIREIVVAWQGALGADPSVTRTKDEAQNLANQLAEKAKDEAVSFPELAWDYSDHSSWMSGGERGRVSEVDPLGVPTEVVETALDLEEGSVAGPIEIPDGFHVVKRIPLAGDGRVDWLRPRKDVAHILVSDEEKARAVLQMVQEGKIPWEALVLQFSEDPESRERDGRILRYRGNKYGREFDRVLKELQLGQVAPRIVKSGSGWHVVSRLSG